jgi:hypothetical protein
MLGKKVRDKKMKEIINGEKDIRCEKWVIEVDNDNECYRILTERNVQEHDGVPEQVWVANVFELDDAVAIVSSHNSAML